jgi:hypothetical protein
LILFLEDVLKQSCIIDKKTKNKSFLKMSVLLKRMGVKNHLFMLALTQEELQGVDPNSDNLTEEQRLRIAYECKINPWYFFREVIRIPAQGGDPVYYELNRANLALLWCFLNSVDTFLTMPRQIGKTVGVLSLADLYMYILGTNINIAMFAKDSDLRTENVRRMKEIKDGIPEWLIQPGSAFNTNNQETIEYKPNKTKYQTFIAQTDTKRAAKQGRGESFIWSHWDEFAYYANSKLSYPSAISATDTVKDLARKNGIPCATIITTTAGYTATEEGKYAYEFTAQALRFSEKLYDSENIEKLKELIDNCSSNGFVYLEFNYRQLGKDEAWFKDRTRNKPAEVIATDYLNKWIHGSGNPIIPKRLIDLLESNIEEPVSITIDNGIIMRWFTDQYILDKEEIKNIPFILASDTSDNIGKDFTTLVMINPKDMAVVMSCRCNQANFVLVANMIFNLLNRFPNLVFIPERNRAAALIDTLIHMILTKTSWSPFRRIYNNYFQNHGESVNVRKLDIELGSVRKAFGYVTSGSESSRQFLYSKVLNTTVERNYSRIFDKVIVDEILGLVVRNGRIDHDASGNDDTLIAYLIGCWFIMYGKNFYLYGIDSNDILSINLGDGEASTNVNDIKNRLKYLQEKIEGGNVSNLMLHSYKDEFKELKSLLPETEELSNDIISLSQIDKVIQDTVPETLDVKSLDSQIKNIFAYG